MPAHADFKILNNGCEAPCKVTFINTSTGTGNTYSWFFPNSFSTEENTEQIFDLPGKYSVSLNASNGGDFSSSEQIVTINQPHIKPVVDFSMQYPNVGMGNGSCTYPCYVEFKNKTLGVDATYLWDFGDGQTSTMENPQYTYFTPGLYTITLTATNAYGTSAASREIRILPHFSQAKIQSVTLNALSVPLSSFDLGENYPHSCPDLYMYVQNASLWQIVIQNRDKQIYTDVQTFPITIENQDDKPISYYENYQLGISDYDNTSPSYEYDALAAQIFFTPDTYLPFIEEVTYPDNSKHWIANVPLDQFSGLNGNIKLEYFL